MRKYCGKGWRGSCPPRTPGPLLRTGVDRQRPTVMQCGLCFDPETSTICESNKSQSDPLFALSPDLPNRNKQMELGWTGRSGGFDARPTSKGSVTSSNGRGGGLPRVSGAGTTGPHRSATFDDCFISLLTRGSLCLSRSCT